MSEQFKNGVSVPGWVLMVVMPLLIAVVTGIVTVKVTGAVTNVKVEAIQKQVDQLEKNKANQEILNEMKEQLKRIDTKLDSYLSNQQKK